MNLPSNINAPEVTALTAGALDVGMQFGLHVTSGQEVSLVAFIGLLAAFLLGNAHRSRNESIIDTNAIKGDKPYARTTPTKKV